MPRGERRHSGLWHCRFAVQPTRKKVTLLQTCGQILRGPADAFGRLVRAVVVAHEAAPVGVRKSGRRGYSRRSGSMWRRRNRGSRRRVPWGGSAVLCLSWSESVQAARVAAALLAHSVTRPQRYSFRLPCRLEASCCCDCQRIGELSRLPGDSQWNCCRSSGGCLHSGSLLRSSCTSELAADRRMSHWGG